MEEENNSNFNPQKDKEKNLYPILVNYLSQFDIHSKRINEDVSGHTGDMNWIHPDVIGFEISNVKAKSFNLFRLIRPNDIITLSSYEVKSVINKDNDLKRYFFQALSNSSWANYGYLVAWSIDAKLYRELKRMSDFFGIGVIELCSEKELYPAKYRELDFSVIEKLCSNKDFLEIYSQLVAVFESVRSTSFQTNINNLITRCDSPDKEYKPIKNNDDGYVEIFDPESKYEIATAVKIEKYLTYPKISCSYKSMKLEGWLNTQDNTLLLRTGSQIFPEHYTERISRSKERDKKYRIYLFEHVVDKDTNGNCFIKSDIILKSPQRASVLFRGKSNNTNEWRYEDGTPYK